MDLAAEFERAMIGIYQRAKKECGYNATRFLQMVYEQKALPAAKRLLAKGGTSDGFTELWKCGRLDLTVEALVVSERFSSLFTEEERKVADERLLALGYRGTK